jgi:prepilin peptidase CpaA
VALGSTVTLLSLGVLAVLLLAATLSDLRRRRIPNRLCIAVALMALPYWLGSDPSFQRLAIQLACAALVGLLMMVPFSYRLLGGGDVKLIAALALWLPPFILYQTLVIIAIGGGVLAVGVILFNRGRVLRPTVPYGVAVAAAGLFQIVAKVNHLIG